MDESVLRNLDAENRRLADLENRLQQLLQGETPNPGIGAGVESAGSYEDLTDQNDRLREAQRWGPYDLDACLTKYQLERLRDWESGERQRWQLPDFVTVGLCGVVGGLATIFDDQVDAQVRAGLGYLKNTDLVQGWEKAARGMPIDYTGPKFGGPAHRVRSAGHDIGRPFEALQQIRSGVFRGSVWEDGVRTITSVNVSAPVSSLAVALTLWAKHLLADVVTPMSLPLPGWTKLYELPNRDLRKFAHDAYQGSPLGNGLNLRSGLLTPTLSLLTTEVIVRSQVHWSAYQSTGSAGLTDAGKRKRSEMLLAGHAIVGAVSLGNAAVRGLLGEGPLALRHVNVPVLARAGFQAVHVIREEQRLRRLEPPSWDELVRSIVHPWQLDAALVLEGSASHWQEGA
jgi:hypothetical protein